MARLSRWLSERYMGLIICGASGAAAGFPLFYVARAWSSPMLLAIAPLGMVAMALGFALAPREPAPARRREPGEGEIFGLSDAEFEALLDEMDAGARDPAPEPERLAVRDAFEQLVRDAIDELPDFVLKDLAEGNLAILVSDGGDEWNALGLYMGGHVRDPTWERRILMFRDTLTRAYGDDPDELRRQVAITLRHEVGHFYGADEQKLRELGL